MMSNQNSLDEPIALSDVRVIVRLLGEIAGMNGSIEVRKRQLMEGLGKLVNADGWFWTLTRAKAVHERPVPIGMMHGGFSETQVASFVKSIQSNRPAPEDQPIRAEIMKGFHFTRTRQQLIPDDQWYDNPLVKESRLDLGLDHYLYSIYPIVLDQVRIFSFIGFYRNLGREAFSDRDRRLAHIVTSEIEWLHHAGIPEDKGVMAPLLPPRRRMVLTLLLEGHDRKTIARLLSIKPNTAKEHIEAVYAHFGVSSQVELICRFSRGDGRDLTGIERPPLGNSTRH